MHIEMLESLAFHPCCGFKELVDHVTEDGRPSARSHTAAHPIAQRFGQVLEEEHHALGRVLHCGEFALNLGPIWPPLTWRGIAVELTKVCITLQINDPPTE